MKSDDGIAGTGRLCNCAADWSSTAEMCVDAFVRATLVEPRIADVHDEDAARKTGSDELLEKLEVLAGLEHLLWMPPLSGAIQLESNDSIILSIDDRDVYLFFGQATVHRTKR